jgi:ferritin-like metal-binding protein YciE
MILLTLNEQFEKYLIKSEDEHIYIRIQKLREETKNDTEVLDEILKYLSDKSGN